jgi:hypothetical protein
MRKRTVPTLLAALALAVVLASCGGGSTTTVKEQTVMRRAKQGATQTFLPEVGGKPAVKPTTYRFSAEGNLIGKELQWHAWGEPKAVAFGKLIEKPASGLEDTFDGSVTASAPQLCDGAMYYTHVLAHLPKQADFVPTEPTKLETPCG